MKTKTIITASAAILLIGGALVAARAHSIDHRAGFHHTHGFNRSLAMLAWKLDLTDAQRVQVKTIFNSEWPTVRPLLERLAAEQNQMFAATSKGTFDEVKIKAIADQQSQAVAQLLVEKERFIAQVYNNVLNPDQRTKADAMRQQWEQRIHQRLQEHSSAQSNSAK
jgi:Spy/CpxP family protein refolding chaperone